MSLEQKFQTACERVKNFKKKPTDSEMLDIYSLYKQATVGDNNIAKPSEAKAKAKWEAWNSKKGINSSKAKEEYVAKVESLAPKYA